MHQNIRKIYICISTHSQYTQEWNYVSLYNHEEKMSILTIQLNIVLEVSPRKLGGKSKIRKWETKRSVCRWHELIYREP